MKRFLKSKKGIALLATIAVAALASGAFAYFTSNGSGSGSANVGSAANDLVISATVNDGPLLPGHTYPVDVAIKNPDAFSQAATSVSPDTVAGDSVTGVTVSGATDNNGGCKASWFHFYGDGTDADSALVLNGGDPSQIAASTTNTYLSSATGAVVGMDESNTNQDDCEGATITFHLTSN